MTLPAVLSSCFAQNFQPKLLFCDNGSRDGTRALLDYGLENGCFPDGSVSVFAALDLAAGRRKNIPFVRYHLCQKVKSEFIFLLDSDVLLPPFVVSDMVKFLNSAKNYGCLGLRCEPFTDHVQFGCCLMRTVVARKIKWEQSRTTEGEFRCECWHARKQLEEIGLTVGFYPDSQARHLKYF